LRLLAGVALVPPLLWLAVLLLLPMGWARDRAVAALKEATGHEVRLAKVRLRAWGGVELRGLEVAAPASPEDPWLVVRSLSVDVRLADLVRGRVEPTACRASGVSLRVRRDASGRLECADLLRSGEASPGTPPADPVSDDAPEVAIALEDASVVVLDEPTATRLEFTGVRGRATYSEATITLSDLSGGLNGGTFDAAARLDRGLVQTIEAEFRARGVTLGVGTRSLAYLIPVLARSEAAGDARARGVLAMNVALKARGETPEALAQSLAGGGRVALDGLDLDASRVLDEVRTLLPVLEGDRGGLGSLQGGFRVADRRVSTSDTVLKVGGVPLNLAGWSDFDGRLDYRVQCDTLGQGVAKLAHRLPPEARDLLADLPVDDLAALAEVRVWGTLEQPRVAPAEGGVLAKKATPKSPARRAADKAKLKEAGRRLLDRVVR